MVNGSRRAEYVENRIIEWSGDEGLKWKTGTHRTGMKCVMDCGGRGRGRGRWRGRAKLNLLHN